MLLDVKVGIGVGNISVLHMGGILNRMEYVAVGEPLVQAFGAEHHASKGHVNISKSAWKMVSKHFEAAEIYDDGVVRLNIDALKGRGKVVKKARVTRRKGLLDGKILSCFSYCVSHCMCTVANEFPSSNNI